MTRTCPCAGVRSNRAPSSLNPIWLPRILHTPERPISANWFKEQAGRYVRLNPEKGDAVGLFGLDVCAGVHTGECETMDEKISGLAVHIGARVAASAAAGEILVSATVKDLVIGSTFQFTDRGLHALKGVPGEWRLYAAAP